MRPMAFRFRGRNTLMYKNWRRRVLEKHKSRCAECGSYNLVECHHIKQYISNPELQLDVDNGICLCFDCHSKKHDFMEKYAHERNR